MGFSCGIISAGLAADCDNLPVPGVETDVYLFNTSEIDKSTSTVVAGVITSLATLSAATGFKFSLTEDALFPNAALNNTGIINTFTHSLRFIPPVFSQVAFTQIEGMMNGSITAFFEKLQPGENEFYAAGWIAGMTGNALDLDPTNADRNGLPEITLQTADNKRESKLFQQMLVTDLAGTRSALDALI